MTHYRRLSYILIWLCLYGATHKIDIQLSSPNRRTTVLGSPQLFAAVNQSNAEEAWGVASILGQHPLPYLRFDYLVSVGEGLSPCQLDTEIMSGVNTTQDLAQRIRAKLQ